MTSTTTGTETTVREDASVANFGRPAPGQTTPQSNDQSGVASPRIAGYAAIACLRCKKQHKKCDKELPACTSCRKATAAEREAPDYVCNYDYSVLPGGRIEANASSARTPVRDKSEADRSATSGKNALRKLEVDRLRKIFLHCCERDLEIIPNIQSSDKSFFKPNWSKEFEVVAPPEEKMLFETDMWTWPDAKFCLVPLFMKESVIKMRRRGEFSSVPFFFRQNFEKQAEAGKDGWEEMFGERPTMKDVQALLEASEAAATVLAQKRVRSHSASLADVEDERTAMRESNSTRRRLNSDSRSTPTSSHHHHHRHSNSDTKSPNLTTPIIRLYSSSRPRPVTSSSSTPTTSNTASLYSTFIEMITSIQDIIDMLNHEKDKVSRLAAQTSDEFVKGALEDTCAELKKRVEGLRKAEADIQGSDIGPAVKKMLLRNLAKRATDEIEHQGI